MLIRCPECNKEISDKSKQCIHCGFPLESIVNNENGIDDNIILNYINSDKMAYATKYIMNTLNISGKEAIAYLKEFVAKNKHRIQKVDNRPKCPTCGSHNIQPISTAKRAGSLFTFGLASGNIGKSYECKNCKYKW